MVFRYFAETDMLYIELTPGVSTESQEAAPGVVVDFDVQGRVIGVEIEDASTIMDMSKLHVLAVPITNLLVSGDVPFIQTGAKERLTATVFRESSSTYRVSAIKDIDAPRFVSAETTVLPHESSLKEMKVTVANILNSLAAGNLTHESVLPVSIPDQADVRRFALALHAAGSPWAGEAFGWPAEYNPERPEPPLDSQMTFTPADFCIGESGIWFFSLMWEHGADAEPVEFLDNRNIVGVLAEQKASYEVQENNAK